MALDFNSDMSLSRRAMKAELLDAETELRLAYAWRDERCEQSLHRLNLAAIEMARRIYAVIRRC
ncbi:MAG: RNA polymerase factor sigma-32, partial [Pseudomonadota bacterium]